MPNGQAHSPSTVASRLKNFATRLAATSGARKKKPAEIRDRPELLAYPSRRSRRTAHQQRHGCLSHTTAKRLRAAIRQKRRGIPRGRPRPRDKEKKLRRGRDRCLACRLSVRTRTRRSIDRRRSLEDRRMRIDFRVFYGRGVGNHRLTREQRPGGSETVKAFTDGLKKGSVQCLLGTEI